MNWFFWMDQALAQAKAPNPHAEVPIGAALVYQERLIAAARNETIQNKNALAHAEMRVIEQAAQYLEPADWPQATLFVTLEPCPMCMGAILQAHIGQVVFGAYNLKWGSAGTVIDMAAQFTVAPPCQIHGGIRETECSQVLQQFFGGLRHVQA